MTVLIRIQYEGGLPNKGRCRCVASAKSRPGIIFQQTKYSGKKVPQNLKTGKNDNFWKAGHFCEFFYQLNNFYQNDQKANAWVRFSSQNLTARQTLTP